MSNAAVISHIRDMLTIAQSEHEANPGAPKERCGVVLRTPEGEVKVVECANVSVNPTHNFKIGAVEWAGLYMDNEVLEVWHTHNNQSAAPSQADLVELEKTRLPWHIVSWPEGGHSYTLPTGYVAPYEGRMFYHGVLDCYALCKDWYSREMGIELIEIEREDGWWKKNQNLYLDHFVENGFYEVAPEVDVKSLRRGDGLLMQVASRVPNHGAIYLGDGKILHHVQDHLSEITNYGGDWLKRTTHHLRHESQK